MKRLNLLFILGLFIVLSSSISVFAAPPQTLTSNGNDGYQIAVTTQEHITANQNFTVVVHVYNVSNGIVSYQKPSCYLDLYKKNGKRIIFKRLLEKFPGGIGYSGLIDKSNLTPDEYSMLIYCNLSRVNLGGWTQGPIQVVEDADLYDNADYNAIFSVTILLFMFTMAFFLLYFSNQFKLEGDPWGITITKLSISLLLKLLSLATIIYSLFLLKLTTPNLYNVQKVLSSYNLMFIYAIILFFILYFIHQFVVLATNFNVMKENKPKRLGEDK